MPSHNKKTNKPNPYVSLNETRAKQLLRVAKAKRARFRSSLVDLQTLERKKVSWLSKTILQGMGVPSKPLPGAKCPSCGNPGSSFELDHMGPWRQYVAAMAGPHISSGGIIKLSYVRILYNDPENLWWICRNCNSRKSDYISEDGSVPTSGVKGRNVSLSNIY